jgi:hypothetical protein
MGERRVLYRVKVGKSERKSHLEDQGIEGRVIIRWVFRYEPDRAG